MLQRGKQRGSEPCRESYGGPRGRHLPAIGSLRAEDGTFSCRSAGEQGGCGWLATFDTTSYRSRHPESRHFGCPWVHGAARRSTHIGLELDGNADRCGSWGHRLNDSECHVWPWPLSQLTSRHVSRFGRGVARPAYTPRPPALRVSPNSHASRSCPHACSHAIESGLAITFLGGHAFGNLHSCLVHNAIWGNVRIRGGMLLESGPDREPVSSCTAYSARQLPGARAIDMAVIVRSID